MRNQFVLTAIAALGIVASAHAATPPAKMLVSSSPAKDSVTTDPVSEIALEFAEPVELLGVTIYGAAEGVIEAFEKDYAGETPVKRAKRFAIALPAPLAAPGRYKFSYLVTSASIASLNGFFDFTIAGQYPDPKILTMTPTDGETLTAPLTQIDLQLDREVTLLSLDLQRIDGDGDAIAVSTVQAFVDGLTPATQPQTGKGFAFPVDPALTPPGRYAVNYGLIVKQADGTETATTGTVNFTVE
jgi:methionine-rich copper-binding protein CopC